MKISVYIATSLDGFIARQDGGLDWLEGSSGGEDWPENGSDVEDYGFSALLDSVDTMVMGRATYEFVAASGQWPYEGKRTIVLSSTLTVDNVAEHLAGKVELRSAEPNLLVNELQAAGAEHVYVDGGKTIQGFLQAGFVDEMQITRVPILLGSGIRLFGELSADILFEHVATQSFANGLVQSKYRRLVR